MRSRRCTARSAASRRRQSRSLVRDGFPVVLAGLPNMASPAFSMRWPGAMPPIAAEAGTTPNVIEVKLDLEGLPWWSATRPHPEGAGIVEREGILRTLTARRRPTCRCGWSTRWCWTRRGAGDAVRRPVLVVVTEFDLLTARCWSLLPDGAIAVRRSRLRPDPLTERLAGSRQARIGNGEAPALTQARHRRASSLPGGATCSWSADRGVRASRRRPAAGGAWRRADHGRWSGGGVG